MQSTANSTAQPVPDTVDAAPTILITGATGNVGSEVTKLLIQQGVHFRAMVRDPKKVPELTALAGVEVVAGDFNDPDALGQALRGIRRAFLLTPSSEQAEAQQLHFVDQAKQAGVQHIVKLSQLAANPTSPVRFLRYHAVVEQAIRESGMAFTFLRPNLFMQGLLTFRDSIAQQGKFFAAIGDAKISLVDVRDIAAAATTALTEPGHVDKIYTLTGPEAITHAQVADELSTVLGHSVTFVDIPATIMRSELAKIGFPDWQADGLIEDYAHYSRNEAAAVEPGVNEATGRPPRSFTTFAHDYASAFS
ncbi:SDR family oxidoreductase [Spirosoma flavum]|uniref:SDR family oxidoreductase n=1 Tax=Spirosoma flavum TaxID=2048557 RepID=A0ABW6AHV8_9BACT